MAGFRPLLLLLFLASPATAQTAVVVCPPAFDQSIDRWWQHRTASGWTLSKVRRVPAAGSFDAVVIVGMPPPITEMIDRQIQADTGYVATPALQRFGSPPTAASDWAIGQQLGGAAVGRLPATDPSQLADYLDRLITCETRPDIGPWRSQLQLTAGIGGFGPVADAAIEEVTRSMLTDALPPQIDAKIAYAAAGHPMCPPGPFAGAVADRYAAGCGVWVYAGHGNVDGLSVHGRRDEPIFETLEAQALVGRTDLVAYPLLSQTSAADWRPPTHRPPLALLLACYTGAIDAPGGCVAASFWQSPGGPDAVIASTRMTMPYGNARVALALLRAYYQSDAATLGEAFAQAMRMASGPAATPTGGTIDLVARIISPGGHHLEAERTEHARTYVLLGDPTAPIIRPESPEAVLR